MRLFGIPAILIGLGAAMLASFVAGAAALFAGNHTPVVLIGIGQGLILIPAAFWLWRQSPAGFAPCAATGTSSRNTLLFILGLAAVFRALILFAPPHSTDIYRYVWDGRVQANGINPYLYIPADPALAHLRDETIYPGINRRDYAPTIYPPTAQLVYWAATRLGESVTVMKLTMLGFEALAIWALLGLLAARGLPSAWVAIYAWHPLAIWEVAGSGHVDIVAVAFLLLSILAAERGNPWAAGAALAASTLAKYFPLAIAPALWRRGDWKMPLATALVGALLYLPYLSAGAKIFGFLGGYADEGGLRTGEGIMLAAILRGVGFGGASLPLALVIGLGGLAIIAWRAGFRADPGRPDLTYAFAIAAALTALISPPHAWYMLWLVPFLCFVPSAATLYLTIAATALYRVGWPPSLIGAGAVYGPFLVLLIIENSTVFAIKESADERVRA
jgi:alpha-1,6-mannosyltransferase